MFYYLSWISVYKIFTNVFSIPVGSYAALVEHNLVKDIHMYLFHVPLDNEPLSMRYSVIEAAADESLLPC